MKKENQIVEVGWIEFYNSIEPLEKPLSEKGYDHGLIQQRKRKIESGIKCITPQPNN